MDELADYTDHQFETKLQIEIEQLTKNKQAQESPKAYLLGGQPVRSQLSKVGKLYLMIAKPISKKQQLYRSFTKATKSKQICKHRKKKRPHPCHLPKVP